MGDVTVAPAPVWDAAPHHRPLRVTAHLRDVVAYEPHYTLDLAGLIASRVRAMEAAEGSTPTPADGEGAPDYRLPLSRLAAGTEWVWAASCAVTPPGAIQRRYLYRRTDINWIAPYVERPIPKWVHHTSGPYRDVMTPCPTLGAPTLVWYAHGCPDTIRALLRPVLWVGRRRHTGDGRVLSWEVEVCDSDTPERWSFVQGTNIIRPFPLGAAQAWGVPHAPTMYAIRPPAWVPDRLYLLAGPPADTMPEVEF